MRDALRSPPHRGLLEGGPPALEARELRVELGGRAVLDGVSLAAEGGRVLAVVGPNAAGKSTLLRALVGAVAPSAGRCTALGEPSVRLGAAARARLAYVPETHAEQPAARVRELASLRAALYPRFDARAFGELAAAFGLRGDARVRELSRGQRAGLSVGLALAQRPELLVLDDPTLGADPLSRRRLVEALLAFARAPGRTVVLASHELADVERLCDDVAVLRAGRVCASGELGALVGRARGVSLSPAAPAAELAGIEGVLRVDVRRDEVRLVLFGDEPVRAAALAALERRGAAPRGEPWELTFEECALSLLAAPAATTTTTPGGARA